MAKPHNKPTAMSGQVRTKRGNSMKEIEVGAAAAAGDADDIVICLRKRCCEGTAVGSHSESFGYYYITIKL